MVTAIIPARYGSSRLPAKPLLDLGGKPLIQRVYEAVQTAECIDQTIVATDDERIVKAVQAFGGQAVMTSSGHQSGTDRIAEVARSLDAEFILNVQGDEPFIQQEQLQLVVDALKKGARIATLAHPIDDPEELVSPHVVKVVSRDDGRALYFSRSAIPFVRDQKPADWIGVARPLRHLGLYGFQRETLLELAQLPPSELEQLEKLEQLRWLQAGYDIQLALTTQAAIGIDTPEDLAAARRHFPKPG